MKRYFSLESQDNITNITIYGDITSWAWDVGDMSSAILSKRLETVSGDVNVYINSYGGEVKEGLAIYNALKRHNGKVRTYCDGFACSIASVIFMAGKERLMSNASLLMIHNAWTECQGNALDFRKQADDLDTITQASMNAYLDNISIDEKELKKMMDRESWITPQEALEKGFATKIVKDEQNAISQSIRNSLFSRVLHADGTALDDEGEKPERREKIPKTENTGEHPEDEDRAKETSDSEETTDDPDRPEKDDEEIAEQRMLGFFNAILHI